jgi:hypothetical protein
VLCLSHPLWVDHSNYTWERIQVMKLLIMQPSPAFGHYICLRSIYSQHPVLKLLQSVFSHIYACRILENKKSSMSCSFVLGVMVIRHIKMPMNVELMKVERIVSTACSEMWLRHLSGGGIKPQSSAQAQ